MNYSLPNTAANQGLVQAVNRRINSDAVMLSAKAFALRFGGIGIAGLLIGAGVGAALYGYAYVTDSRTSGEKMAAALADALTHVSMGHVELAVPDTAKLPVVVPANTSLPLD